MPTVLVVDDEAAIRELVSVYLTAAGYGVITAEDGSAGLAVFRELRPDLVVLDIMIPGLDGEELCSAIRAESHVPIIMLTARESEFDKVALLDRGADDYMTKPFSPAELVARVRALLRRAGEYTEGSTGHTQAEPLVLGGLRIDPATREVSVDGERIDLTSREFDLLSVMVEEPGIVFSRETLLERVWGYDRYTEPRGVDVHVRHIREKLHDDAIEPRFIETVRGVGYRVRREAK